MLLNLYGLIFIIVASRIFGEEVEDLRTLKQNSRRNKKTRESEKAEAKKGLTSKFKR